MECDVVRPLGTIKCEDFPRTVKRLPRKQKKAMKKFRRFYQTEMLMNFHRTHQLIILDHHYPDLDPVSALALKVSKCLQLSVQTAKLLKQIQKS